MKLVSSWLEREVVKRECVLVGMWLDCDVNQFIDPFINFARPNGRTVVWLATIHGIGRSWEPERPGARNRELGGRSDDPAHSKSPHPRTQREGADWSADIQGRP